MTRSWTDIFEYDLYRCTEDASESSGATRSRCVQLQSRGYATAVCIALTFLSAFVHTTMSHECIRCNRFNRRGIQHFVLNQLTTIETIDCMDFFGNIYLRITCLTRSPLPGTGLPIYSFSFCYVSGFLLIFFVWTKG